MVRISIITALTPPKNDASITNNVLLVVEVTAKRFKNLPYKHQIPCHLLQPYGEVKRIVLQTVIICMVGYHVLSKGGDTKLYAILSIHKYTVF